MSKPQIIVKNLTKKFKVVEKGHGILDIFKPTVKYVTAVKNLTFNIEANESVAILGPNGAGKTTTIKMLTGLMYPTQGTVNVLGYTPFKREKPFLKKISLILGNKGGLNWDLTPIQNFQLIKDIYDIPPRVYKSNLDKLVSLLNVGHRLNVQVRKLSLGERMKLEFIASLLYNPQILFLDEPTIGLDVLSKQNIRHFLKSYRNQNHSTLILTSHDMDDVEEISERIIIINQGQKIFDGKMDKLLKKFGKKRQVTFILSKPLTQTDKTLLQSKIAKFKANVKNLTKDTSASKAMGAPKASASQTIGHQKTSISNGSNNSDRAPQGSVKPKRLGQKVKPINSNINIHDPHVLVIDVPQENLAPLISFILTKYNVNDIDIKSTPLKQIIIKLMEKGGNSN